ncbi:hypothetical protein [Nitrospirillum iridis]|uniref:DUF4410 domain-containing protein n=1 Tax=Nitrospirillum iridis TaxID=765888 RepID=A0A7X0B1E6_9PROT|nr:hypothetical protein [Nitrospirillum iridis]MBB6253999.1 hypothetical protein [Nitrospirillum iridis]
MMDAMTFMNIKALAPLPFLLVPLLAGCVPYSSSEAVKALPADVSRDSHVSDIEFKALPPDASPEFKGKLELALHSELAKCAKGSRPLRMEVRVARFHGENAGRAVLLGDSNIVRGSIQLVDPATGTLAGDYDINRSVGAAGVLGAIGLSGAEGQMAQAFATQVCEQAFKAEPKKDH